MLCQTIHYANYSRSVKYVCNGDKTSVERIVYTDEDCKGKKGGGTTHRLNGSYSHNYTFNCGGSSCRASLK